VEELGVFVFQKTRYFLLQSSTGRGLLAFDAGWPSSFAGYAKALKTTGHRIEEVRWALVSHFHLDHAGLVRDFQDRDIVCIVFEGQLGAIDGMEELVMRKYPDYRPIKRAELLPLRTSESRSFLEGLGIAAEIIPTPGHSEDSVSLVTDDHQVLIGDLYPPSQIMEDDAVSHRSWDRIRAMGGRRIYPSHAEVFELED
jgi:glyoxylase-like metal-dependent hydrolase (beta-lactamase superfamily II)